MRTALHRPRTTSGPRQRGPLALALGGAVALLALVGVTQVHVPTTTAAVADYPVGDLRLLDWNLHYGVSADPSVRLDEMAATIAESGADVVTLQEVSRGWVLGGGADMATYLARTTGMRVVFAPAADRQFGNAILWDPLRGDLTDVVRHALPYRAGPQERSALSATVDAAGVPVRVTSVHVQHREENTPTASTSSTRSSPRSPSRTRTSWRATSTRSRAGTRSSCSRTRGSRAGRRSRATPRRSRLPRSPRRTASTGSSARPR